MKAAILYKTEERIDCDRINIREQIEDILDDPENLQFKEFSDDNSMFSMIHDALGKPNVGVTACNIWENKNTIYAGYFVDIIELIDHGSVKDDSEEKMMQNIKNIHKNIKLNMFASQLSSQHVTGNFVIVKKNLSYVIDNNNVKTDTTHDTLTHSELIDVFENIFIKDGIVINPDGSMSSYQYIMNPLEHLMLTDAQYAEHYIYHEYEVYTHVIMVIVDTREIQGIRNHIGSFLTGKPVNGTIFVAMYKKPEYNENPPYIGLTVDRLQSILSLRQRSTTITTGMTNSDREYVNFEKLLELENIKHADKPLLDLSEITGQLLNMNVSTQTPDM